MPRQTRDQFLRRAGLAGGALLIPGSLAGVATASAPEGDVAYLRLLVGAELLAADFQAQAIAQPATGVSTAVLRKMIADEKAHYSALAQLVERAGQTAATANDIDFSYPKGAFASERSMLDLAARVESVSLGAYLGAVENLQTPELRLPIGQIAANEAQHVGALGGAGRPAGDRARVRLRPCRPTPPRRRWMRSRADEEAALLGERSGGGARDQPRHAPSLGQARAGSRWRATAATGGSSRRRRRSTGCGATAGGAPKRTQPVPGDRDEREGRGADGAGGDGRAGNPCDWSRS